MEEGACHKGPVSLGSVLGQVFFFEMWFRLFSVSKYLSRF